MGRADPLHIEFITDKRRMSVLSIQQGEQYGLPILVKRGSTIITPDLVDKVSVGIGLFVETWPDGDLTFNQEMNRWIFPLTQTQSFVLSGNIQWQVECVLTNGDIIRTKTQRLVVEPSLLKRRYSNE